MPNIPAIGTKDQPLTLTCLHLLTSYIEQSWLYRHTLFCQRINNIGTDWAPKVVQQWKHVPAN